MAFSVEVDKYSAVNLSGGTSFKNNQFMDYMNIKLIAIWYLINK